MQEAIRQSLKDDAPSKESAVSTDLLGFDSPPPPPPNQTGSTNTLVPYVYGGPPPSQYAQPVSGFETPFGYAQQQQLTLPASTSANPPFSSDPWAPNPAATALQPVSPAYQQPQQTGYATQQLYSSDLVPAPSAPSPYAGMVAPPMVGQQGNPNPFGYSPQPFTQPTASEASNSYPVQQQQQQPPAPHSNVTSSFGGQSGGGGGFWLCHIESRLIAMVASPAHCHHGSLWNATGVCVEGAERCSISRVTTSGFHAFDTWLWIAGGKLC